MLCIFQSQHKWLDVSNLTLSSWDTSHDTIITVTLYGIQIQTCYWNISDLNLNISKSLLPEMTLTIDERKRNNLKGFNKPSVIVYNSTVQHLIGSSINLHILQVYIIDPQTSDKPIFMLESSWVEIVDSRFHGINVTRETDQSAAVLYIYDCQAKVESSHFSSNSAHRGTIRSDTSRMTVSNCKFQQNQGEYGGALCVIRSNVSLMSSEFKGNQAKQGGALNIQHRSELTIYNCKFQQNQGAYGGALVGFKSTNVSLMSSEFKRNQASEGGAMIIQDRSELTIHNCKFQQNQGHYGGALSTPQSRVSLMSSEFKGNQAIQGGAINAQDDSILTIKKCSFKSNKATGSSDRDAPVKLKEFRRNLRAAKSHSEKHWQGNLDLGNINHTGDLFMNRENQGDDSALGAAILSASNVTITIVHSEFIGNSAAGGISGAICVFNNSQLEVHSSLLANNTAFNGGAIAGGKNVTITVNNTVFTNNTGFFGGAILLGYGVNGIFTNTSFIANSALYDSIQKSFNDDTQQQANIRKVELNKNMLYSNTTQSNNARKEQWNSRNKQKTGIKNKGHPFKQIFMRSNPSPPMGGAIIASNDVMIHIQTSIFINNTAANGGDAGALEAQSDVTLHIEDSVFDGNSAEHQYSSQGGAINVQMNVTMTMKNTTLSNNHANGGGGLLAAVHVDLHIINCTFLNNSAQNVGALFIGSMSRLTVTNSLFINNTGYEAFGAIVVQGGSTGYIVGCNFSGNTGARGSAIDVDQSLMNISHVSFTNVSPNIIYLTSSLQVYMSDCTIKNNSLRQFTPGNDDIYLITISDNSNAHITGCKFMYNDFHGIGFVHLIASKFYIDKSNIMHNSLKANFKVTSGFLSMNNCNVSFNNISSDGGLVRLEKSRIFMDKCGVHNNSAGGSGGIIAIESGSGNISIWNSSFSFNVAKQNGGVIYLIGNGYTSLSVVNSLFLHNHAEGNGAVMYVEYTADIALDSCNFTGNTAQTDSALYMYLDGCSSFRTAMCHFGSTIDSSACSIYFFLGHSNTDYLTYRTLFHTGGRTLNTSEHDFLQKAVSAGVIVVNNGGHPYNVTNEETPYATGEHQLNSTVVKDQRAT